MASLDLRPEAAAESLVGRELDAVLLGQRVRERGSGDVSALDQDLTEPLAGRLLRRQSLLELLSREEPLLNEERAKRTPRDARRSHRSDFASTAAGLEPIP